MVKWGVTWLNWKPHYRKVVRCWCAFRRFTGMPVFIPRMTCFMIKSIQPLYNWIIFPIGFYNFKTDCTIITNIKCSSCMFCCNAWGKIRFGAKENTYYSPLARIWFPWTYCIFYKKIPIVFKCTVFGKRCLKRIRNFIFIFYLLFNLLFGFFLFLARQKKEYHP